MSDPHSTSAHSSAKSEAMFSEEVAVAVDRLAAAWQQVFGESALPDWKKWIPVGDDQVRRAALVELIKVDLKYRWQRNLKPQKLEAYVSQMPELGSLEKLPLELVRQELRMRIEAGDRITGEELQTRFSDQAEVLGELVDSLSVPGSPTCTYHVDTKKKSGAHKNTELATDVRPHVEDAREFAPGNTIDDFQLLAELGRGAFAQVFLARQVSMERLVALKISSHQGREPQTLAQLDHTNIVRVFDQRTVGKPTVRLLYMEVVPGGSLLPLVRRIRETSADQRSGQLLLDLVDENLGASGTPRPQNSASRHWLAEASWPMAVCQLGAQLAEGLAYAHEKSVLHRDIKPANVLLTPEGVPKLADFNVSYHGGRDGESPEDTFGGSLAYMSPEQLRACHPMLGGSPKRVREASDVYSLGLVLWELLCGRRPFDDEPKESATELTRIQRMVDRRHYADFAEVCDQLPKDCPESLKQVLVRCLQPREEERFGSAEEAARALRLCLSPQSWKLMQEPKNLLASLPIRFPMLALAVAGLVPNALAGAFNLAYNRQRIGDGRFSQAVVERFDAVQLCINSLVFPLGLIIGLWVAIRIRRSLLTDKPGDGNGQQVLFFGFFVSMLSVVLWTISGIAFPIAVNLGLEVPGAVGFYTHFFMSLVLCGIVAMAFPYFLLTALAVRLLIPALVRNGVIVGPRWHDLARLRRLNKIHLALSVLVPFLGVLLVAAADAMSGQRWAMMLVGGGGLVGCALLLLMERLIDRDLDALQMIAVGAPRPR